MSLNYSTLIFVLFTTVIFIGCSSRPSPQVNEFFSTEIMADNSKRFYFSLIISNSSEKESSKQVMQEQNRKGKGGSGRGSGNGKGKGGKDNTQSNQPNTASAKSSKTSAMVLELEERLTNQLALNSYCRTGYMVLEKNIGRALMSLRGECHENATERDRQRFLNK